MTTPREWTEGQLWVGRGLLIGSFLLVWQLGSGRLLDPFWFSDPWAIGQRLVQWIGDGTLLFHFWITLQEMMTGFVGGVVLGSAAGLWLGRARTLARLLHPLILAVYSLPKIALAPLFVLWFGVGMLPKIVLSGAVVFFLVFFNAYAGVREVDDDLIDTVRLMGGGKSAVRRFVLIPSALVWVFTGLKISVPYALVGAVVGEMMASNKGLGSLIQESAAQFDTAGIFAALAALLVLSVVLNELLSWLERRVLRWKRR
ncbi:MAG: ABC transporter permease [Pseudomonadota bacterium]